MENLFVLPTDKPSRLVKNGSNVLLLTIQTLPLDVELGCFPHNIYITSDEEIKVGDWVFNPYTEYPYKADYKVVENFKQTKDFHIKKIILTTDQDLINDGVQAIDDDFLEWFVKNPSCDSVDIKTFRNPNGKIVCYKITIPQEEPKFEDSIENSINIMSIANSMFSKKEEPKQETLEEVAENYINKFYSHYVFKELLKPIFIDAVKFQQEQDKNKYSEEEVLTHLNNLIKMPSSELDKFTNDTGLVTMKWFEQFKKK
jgi:hypothetical protein